MEGSIAGKVVIAAFKGANSPELRSPYKPSTVVVEYILFPRDKAFSRWLDKVII